RSPQHKRALCGAVAGTHPRRHRGIACGVPAAPPVAHRQGSARKREPGLLLARPLVLRGPPSVAAAAIRHPTDQWPDCRQDRLHSSARPASPWEDMPDSPPLCGKHPARTAPSADCSAPPERTGRTTMARWHRGSLAAPSSPVLRRENQESRCCARLHIYRSSVSPERDRKSTRLNSSHVATSYAGFCLKKKRVLDT